MRTNRLREIENYLIEHNTATIQELCDQFSVSVNTIRRDIGQLVQSGKLQKVYGGVVLNTNDPTVPFNDRSPVATREKQFIGRLAARLVSPGDTIYIDSGTTAVEIVPHLKANVTVVSNSLIVQNRVLQMTNINLVVIGGQFNRKTLSCSGPIAVNSLRDIRIRKAFMSTTGISIEAGSTNNSLYEAEIKREVIEKAHEVIMLADHSKFNQSATICFCPLERLSALITDRRPDPEYIDFCARNNIRLHWEPLKDR